MKLIVDSGSTKSIWVYSNNGVYDYYNTIGLNPYFITYDQLNSVIIDVKHWLSDRIVREVFFFGAGCNSIEKSKLVSDLLLTHFVETKVIVDSDLVGAAISLYGKDNGIAVILGTGSNSGYYDGLQIVNKTNSLGYILGDEGSGAYIGKKFISNLLNDNLSNDIMKSFSKEFKMDKLDILDSVYKKPFANRFLASFCEFLKLNENNEQVNFIIESSFEDLFNIHLLKYPQLSSVKLGFVGSVAWAFSNQLKLVSTRFNVQINDIVKTPIEGMVKNI